MAGTRTRARTAGIGPAGCGRPRRGRCPRSRSPAQGDTDVGPRTCGSIRGGRADRVRRTRMRAWIHRVGADTPASWASRSSLPRTLPPPAGCGGVEEQGGPRFSWTKARWVRTTTRLPGRAWWALGKAVPARQEAAVAGPPGGRRGRLAEESVQSAAGKGGEEAFEAAGVAREAPAAGTEGDQAVPAANMPNQAVLTGACVASRPRARGARDRAAASGAPMSADASPSPTAAECRRPPARGRRRGAGRRSDVAVPDR